MNIDANTASLYSDTNKLKSIRAAGLRKEADALNQSATQFESLLLNNMLESMRDAYKSFQSETFSGHAFDVFQGMYFQQLAQSLAETGQLGLADQVAERMAQYYQANQDAEIGITQ